MIVAKEFPGEVFTSKHDLFKKLIENKDSLIAQKKMQNKYADSFEYSSILIDKKINSDKAASNENLDPNTLKVVSIINTTNILDSHMDVHIPGIWNKTVKENKNMLLLDQHRATFEGIISDNIQAKVKKYNWIDLGYDAEGKTEALVFESILSKDRNPYMYEQYEKGRVKNHSVGMRYVKLSLCINSDAEWNKEEKENWDNYIDEVINKKEAEIYGYFWAVTEAKAMEGSAVVFGSNPITPTLQVKNDNEPEKSTQSHKEEPSDDTLEANKLLSLIKF